MGLASQDDGKCPFTLRTEHVSGGMIMQQDEGAGGEYIAGLNTS